jgi:hypothetical protein
MRLTSVGCGVVLSGCSVVLFMDAISAFYPLALHLQLKLVALEVLVCQLLDLLKRLLEA